MDPDINSNRFVMRRGEKRPRTTVRVNRFRLTVTAEADAAGPPVTEDVLTDLIARASGILQGTVSRCSRSVDGVMQWEQIEGDLVVVDFPVGFQGVRDWEPKIFAEMLAFHLLEESHGLRRVDVSSMVNRI